MNILIAEDHPILQLLNQKLMHNWGFDFDMASDGVEAVEYVQKNAGRYDLCIMDVEMPRMNGIEATKAIRRTGNYLPILVLTSDERYRAGCLAAGADEFAVKPCAPPVLLSKIRALTIKRTIAGWVERGAAHQCGDKTR